MHRRTLLAGGTGLLGLAACSIGRESHVASPALAATRTGNTSTSNSRRISTVGSLGADAGGGPLSATVEYQGNTLRYDETAGTDLGDYTDPLGRFVQGCVSTTRSELPMTVFFRRDRTSDRAEVVFELGRLWPQKPPENLQEYRVTIMRGDKTVFTADVPRHFWFSRWRWQSAARPVTATVADLMARGLIPHYDNSVNRGTARPTRLVPYEIMGLAGILPYMPTTGERHEIGPITEQQAEFVCTGRESALDAMLAQAEAAGTLPWHFRDEHTGAPIDKLRYPRASVYAPRVGDPFIARTQTGIQIDSPHQPAIAYLPFLLTGDPYYLETMQFQVAFDELEGPPGMRTGQVRAYAWSIRTLGHATKSTPDNTPKWLLPRSYFQELLNRHREWLTHTFVESTEIPRTLFRTTDQSFGNNGHGNLDSNTFTAPWEEEFLAFNFGSLVQMGFADWTPIFRWKLGSTIARTDGKSGWVRARCTPYRQVLRERHDSPWTRSWAESWELTEKLLTMDPVNDPDQLVVSHNSLTYPSYTRGVLALAIRLGVAEARPSFDWLDREIQRSLQQRKAQLAYKWSITPDV